MLKKKNYEVKFFGGESRQQPGKGCDYMVCWVDDECGDPVELYTEVLEPDGLTVNGSVAWDDIVYDYLKAEIINQAKTYGITAEQLEF